jgi:hypothetical protein
MSEFDGMLTRAFAEAHDEPADDGFSVQVGQAVARRETANQVRNWAYRAGMAAAGVAVFYGGYGLVSALAPDLLATAGLEVARAHGAISEAPTISVAAQGILQALGAGMTQIMLVTAALAGGAVAYRSTQD